MGAKVTQGIVPQVQLEPAGHRVIVKPNPVAEVTKGGIVLVEQTKDNEKRATMVGTVVAIGFQAWKSHGVSAVDESVRGVPWAKVGDTVIYSRYSGADVPEELRKKVDPSAERLVIINDEDCLTVIRGG